MIGRFLRWLASFVIADEEQSAYYRAVDEDIDWRSHRWSGWPGAWCLDCGYWDPLEACLAVHDLEPPEFCPTGEHIPAPCKEPGSRRHDPYATRVHNHGPEDGPGVSCRERTLPDGRLIGACLDD